MDKETDGIVNLLALFESSDFIREGKPNLRKLKKATTEEILSFCHQFSQITAITEPLSSSTLFMHSAALSLSGGRHPCIGLDCRLLLLGMEIE
jgi:hypothetical protein